MKTKYRICKRGLRGLVITIPNRVSHEFGIKAGQDLEFDLIEGKQPLLAFKLPARKGGARKKGAR